jgi:hypothetical protein
VSGHPSVTSSPILMSPVLEKNDESARIETFPVIPDSGILGDFDIRRRQSEIQGTGTWYPGSPITSLHHVLVTLLSLKHPKGTRKPSSVFLAQIDTCKILAKILQFVTSSRDTRGIDRVAVAPMSICRYAFTGFHLQLVPVDTVLFQ